MPFETLPNLSTSASYRCTYDILRHLKPDADGGNIWVYWLDEYNGGRCITVSGCDVCWNSDDLDERLSELLGSEIIIKDDDISLTDSELLEDILWELTFDGYTPKNYRDTANALALSNPYKKAYWGMVYRRNKRYMLKCDKEEFREYHNEYDWEYNYYRNKNRKKPSGKNRSKRKRDFRQRNRLKILKKMGQVEDVVRMVLTDGSSLTRGRLEWLFRTEALSHRSYQSYSYNPENRMSYIYRLLTEYNGCLFDKEYYTLKNNTAGSNGRNTCDSWIDKEYRRFIVVLNISPDYPLTNEEADIFEKILALDPKENIMVGFGYDRKLCQEAEIIAISASDELDTEPRFFAFESVITPYGSFF